MFVLGLQHSGRIGVPVGLLAAVLMLAPGATVQAQDEREAGENRGSDAELDSEHLFGFTEGADIGMAGEKELEQETTGRLGKRGGSFRAFDPTLTLKLPLTNDFRLAPGVSFYGYDTPPAVGLPARTTGGFNGAFLETRVRLLDRRTAPLGLTLNIVPSIGTVDPVYGFGSRSYGSEAGLLLDRELIPGRLIAAANFNYAFASTRRTATNEQALGSGLEVSGALAYQVQPGFFLGGEVRYARAYDGLALDRLSGEAVYLGPTIYHVLSEHAWASFAWNYQLAGHAVGEPGRRDLSNFDRHQLRLRIGYSL
jgi:hypothetical protein